MDGDQRRRARRVDGHARALQSEDVRQAAGRGIQQVAGAEVHPGIDLVGGPEQDLAVIVGADADEHAGIGSGEAIGSVAGAFERFPGDLEQQALLRIHARRFPRRNPEVPRVELIDPVEKAAAPRVHLPRSVRIRVVEGVDIPAIGRHFRDGVRAVAEQGPERLGARDAAGQPAAGPDDGDGLGAGALELVDAGAHLPERQQRLLIGGQPAGFRGFTHCYVAGCTDSWGTVEEGYQDPRPPAGLKKAAKRQNSVT